MENLGVIIGIAVAVAVAVFFGTRSERAARLIDQMELELEELEADSLVVSEPQRGYRVSPVSVGPRVKIAPFNQHLPPFPAP